jgi:hypothetical protein
LSGAFGALGSGLEVIEPRRGLRNVAEEGDARLADLVPLSVAVAVVRSVEVAHAALDLSTLPRVVDPAAHDPAHDPRWSGSGVGPAAMTRSASRSSFSNEAREDDRDASRIRGRSSGRRNSRG